MRGWKSDRIGNPEQKTNQLRHESDLNGLNKKSDEPRHWTGAGTRLYLQLHQTTCQEVDWNEMDIQIGQEARQVKRGMSASGDVT